MTMTVNLVDLIQPLTIAEARTTVYNLCAVVGIETTAWKDGAVTKALVEVLAVLLCGISVVLVAVAKSGLREYATGDWLTIHARGFYGVDRIEATFATGEVTLTNSLGGVYSLDAGDLIVANPTTGKQYTNTSHIDIGAVGGATAVVDVDIQAVEAGSASTSTAGTITSLITPLLGVTCTNAAAVIGQDEEIDSALRSREDESIDALSPNGPAGAYLAAAKLAERADGTNVGVTRCAVSAPSSTGVLTVTVASATGAITGTVGGAGTDLYYVNNAIQGVSGVGGCVPLGVTATVASAVALTIPVTSTLYVYTTDSRSDTEIEDAIEVLLTAWMAAKPIGGDNGNFIYLSAIRSQIMSVSEYAYNCAIAAPSGDQVVATNEAPVIGTVTTTIVRVAP